MALMEVRLRTLLGLLSRPTLSDEHIGRLQHLLSHPKWKPVPRIPCINVLEPLYRHHLLALLIDEDRVFLKRTHDVLHPPSFVDLMRSWSMRRREVEQFASQVEGSSLRRIMLFKGAAIAPLYPSSSLRQMVDLDCVVDEEELPQTRQFLRRIGLVQSRSAYSETWAGTGMALSIDLHCARTPLAREMLRHAIPASRLIPQARVLTVPSPSDHLLLVAQHAADNAGNRIWRDICDAQALLTSGANPSETLIRARGTSAYGPVEALFAFMRRWCASDTMPDFPLSIEGRRLLSIYNSASVQSVSPVQLDLVGSMLFDAPMNILRRIVSRRWSVDSTPSTVVERDPVLGTLPAHGTAARFRLRLKLLSELARTGRLARISSLAFRQALLRKNRRMFETPGP